LVGERNAHALGEPFSAFTSWFLRIECERCHKVQWLNQTHMPRSDLPLRTILARARHEGCGGRAEQPPWPKKPPDG